MSTKGIAHNYSDSVLTGMIWANAFYEFCHAVVEKSRVEFKICVWENESSFDAKDSHNIYYSGEFVINSNHADWDTYFSKNSRELSQKNIEENCYDWLLSENGPLNGGTRIENS